MIDERLLKDIINAVDNTKTKVLFCGDPFQLPPVKAARPPVCDLDRVFIDVENINRSNIQQKILYTAITRASQSISVYCGSISSFGANNDDFIDLDTLFD